MKPMSEERLAEIDGDMRQRGYVGNDTAAELLAEVHRLRDRLKAVETNRDRWRAGAEAEASAHDEVRDELDRLRTLPPEVAAAMERYKKLHGGPQKEDAADAIAAHFTTLFTKGSQP